MNGEPVDAEQELAAAAAAFSAVMTAVESRGVKKNSSRAEKYSALRKELAALNLASKALNLAANVTDEQMLLLAARYRRVAGLVFDTLISFDSGGVM